jgi:hypothetical protein
VRRRAMAPPALKERVVMSSGRRLMLGPRRAETDRHKARVMLAGVVMAWRVVHPGEVVL